MKTLCSKTIDRRNDRLGSQKVTSSRQFFISDYKPGARGRNPITIDKICFKTFKTHWRQEEGAEQGTEQEGKDEDAYREVVEQLLGIMDSLEQQADPSDVTFTAALFRLAIFLRTTSLNTADPTSPFRCRQDGSNTGEASLTPVCQFLARYLPSEDPCPKYAAPLLDCIASLSQIWPPLRTIIPPAQLLQICLLASPPLQADTDTSGMTLHALETEPDVPSESPGPCASSPPPEIVLMPVNLGALPRDAVSLQIDRILSLLGVDTLPVNLSEFDRAAVSIRYDQLLSRPEMLPLLRHCASLGGDTASIRLGATPPGDRRNPISLRLDSFHPQDFSVRFDVLFSAPDLLSTPVNLDSFPLDALSIRFDEFTLLLDVEQFDDLQKLPSDALLIRLDVISSPDVLPMLWDLFSPAYIVSFPWPSASPPPGSVSPPMDADSSVSNVGYSAVVALFHEFATPDLFADGTFSDAAVLEKLLLCMRILPHTLRFLCDSATTPFHFWPSGHAAKIASIVRRITLDPCFEFNEDYGRIIVLLLDALLQDVRFPSIILDVAVLLQEILQSNSEYKMVLADFNIIGRLFLCLPQNRRVISASLLSELSTLASQVCKTLPEIVVLVRTVFWDLSCRFAPDMAGRFLRIFTSLLNETGREDAFIDDCLTPEQVQQLHRKFMQEEVRVVVKLNWLAFLAQLLPRVSSDFLKDVCLSPSFLEEFSETIDFDDWALIHVFLSAMEHLKTICTPHEWDVLVEELLCNESVCHRLAAVLEANTPDDEECPDVAGRVSALFPDFGSQ
jgi:hypothetical protein